MLKEKIKKVVQKILDEAFWGEYTYAKEEIVEILLNPDREKERFFVFQKALFNLKEPAILTRVFSEEEIKKYLESLD